MTTTKPMSLAIYIPKADGGRKQFPVKIATKTWEALVRIVGTDVALDVGRAVGDTVPDYLAGLQNDRFYPVDRLSVEMQTTQAEIIRHAALHRWPGLETWWEPGTTSSARIAGYARRNARKVVKAHTLSLENPDPQSLRAALTRAHALNDQLAVNLAKANTDLAAAATRIRELEDRLTATWGGLTRQFKE